MPKKNIPCYYHPTTPVFIDDDPDFLSALADGLSQQLACKTFTDPKVALPWLRQTHDTKSTAHFSLTSFTDEIPEHRFTDLDIQTIREQIYNPQRFSLVAVLVVDYTMPGLDGLSFCQNLADTDYKKILLTGELNEKMAVDAFNQGLIQGYLRKDDALLAEKLTQMIYALEQDYFFDVSRVVIDTMAVKSPVWGSSLFNDPSFADIFYPFFEKQKPVEYYLSALTGSFLFVNAQGVLSELAVIDEDSIKMLEDLIQDEDNPPLEVLSLLQSRKKLLAHHAKLIESPPIEWLPYLYPAQKMVSKDQNYYYSYIEEVKLPSFQPDKIFSYQAYLQTQQAESK